MKNVTEFENLPAVSVRSLSQLLEVDRDLVRHAFDRANLQPIAKRGGYPAYAFREAIKALFSRKGDVSPDLLTPADRRALADARLKEHALKVKDGEYLPREAYRAASAVAFAKVASTIRSLPDNLERKAGLEAAAVDLLEQIVDSTLDELASDLEKTYTENSDPA